MTVYNLGDGGEGCRFGAEGVGSEADPLSVGFVVVDFFWGEPFLRANQEGCRECSYSRKRGGRRVRGRLRRWEHSVGGGPR